ncbi:hypothetical protein KQI63_07980 [bacterium]|nr:hypothetical protein [bacterium]
MEELSQTSRWGLGRRFLVYSLFTAVSVGGFFALVTLFHLLLDPFSVPDWILYTITILLIGGIYIGLRHLISGLLSKTVMRRNLELRQRSRLLSESLSNCTLVEEAAEIVLSHLEELFQIDDMQLTLYYDQPFALEVTHLHRKDGKILKDVERVREDEPNIDLGDGETLTPLTAAVTEVLTHRDRLVGLLLLGEKKDGKPLSSAEVELLGDLVPVIASGVDQVVMIRHLSETNQRLFESEKLVSIGQLASGIAHEIRNPLTSIKMNLQGLRKTANLADRNERRIQISLDEIGRLDAIVTELMSFARRTKLVVQPTTAQYLIEQSLELAESELQDRNIQAIVEIDEDAPEIRADDNRLIRALLNLIINAAQAMEEGGTIRLAALAYGAGLEIQVEDEGPGISEELRREVFNPFFTTKAQGTGLGLANALKFVQEHGGELDYTTEIGAGTTFSLRLPPSPPSHLDDPSALKVVPT